MPAMPIPPSDVAVLVGSLRAASFSRKMALAMAAIAPASLRLSIVEIGALPHYNEDLDIATPPESWVAFRQAIAAADAVLFVTPEYNRSVPGVLKNAIDVGSRPYGRNVFNHKPAAIASVVQGALGGFGANHHLRQSLVFLNMPVLQQPEAYIGGVARLIATDGSFANDDTRAFIRKFLEAFVDWIGRTKPR
jgi:chromate reductase, NAD(P)H dehydrogenase (quinone)